MSLYFNAIIEKRRLYHLYLNVEIEKKANPKSHPTKYRVCTSFNVNIEKKQILETTAISSHSRLFNLYPKK